MSRWLRTAEITDEQVRELLYKIKKNIKMFRNYGYDIDKAVVSSPELETVYNFIKNYYLDLFNNLNTIKDTELKTDVVVTLMWLNTRFFDR